jgi:hypothetical protein
LIVNLGVGSVRVTPQQFQAVAAAGTSGDSGNPSPTAAQRSTDATSGPSGSVTNSAATSTPETPPIITIIIRDNPAIIHVGDTYSDLGANITGPQQDTGSK